MEPLYKSILCGVLISAAFSSSAQASAGQVCPLPPAPVIQLKHGSRYIENDDSRSIVDATSNADVNASLKPIDEFIRQLSKLANDVSESAGSDQAAADCLVSNLAEWADADALSKLENITAKFSIGSRLAGIGLAYRQARDHSQLVEEKRRIDQWVLRRSREQMLFWEEEATFGSKRGNLRAWATLGINVAGEMTQDDSALRWSAWSATFLQCQALEDGSIPQEMKRGKYALHYQLHAIAPLVTTTLLLEDQGLSILGVCDDALQRIVKFAVTDLKDGAKSEIYSGKVQSYFDGTESLQKFELAWLDAYLKLYQDHELEELARRVRPLSHSKLGGRQELVW